MLEDILGLRNGAEMREVGETKLNDLTGGGEAEGLFKGSVIVK